MNNDLDGSESLAAEEHPATGVKAQKTISIKKAIIIAIVIILVALGFYYKSIIVAATVNGSSISRLAVIRELEKESGKKTLDMLITQKLIDSEASKKGIVISDDDINTEIKNIENQIKAQGQTLDQALAAQGISKDDFKKQIIIRKQLEKLLADKIQVTDDEVGKYIKDNKLTPPKGQEVSFTGSIKEQLKQQKFSDSAGSFVDSLRSQATIEYYVKY